MEKQQGFPLKQSMAHTLASGESKTACEMTSSPLEGFLGKSGLNQLLRAVTVKEALPSSVELLHIEGSLAQRNAGFHSFKEIRL